MENELRKNNQDAISPMVMIEWRDAKFFPGTCDKEEILQKKMALFRSLGYLIIQDSVSTVIAAELNDEGEYRDITLIPTGSILSTKELIIFTM